MLPPLTTKERKAQRGKARHEQKMTMAVTVSRSQLDSRGSDRIDTQILYRIARKLDVNVKRKTGQRGWDDIRSDVQGVWPDGQDSIELPAC